MPDLSTKLGPITLKNPLVAASGTFGYGREYMDFCPPSVFGAVTVKGVSLFPWDGNPPPRLAEATSGLLNSIGLQNPGVKKFLHEPSYLPFLRKSSATIFVNICGRTVDEYREVAMAIDAEGEGVSALEINISCPNIKEGGIAFGTDIGLASRVVADVRKASSLPIITKLSPNVSNIGRFAKAVIEAGADIISLINTIPAMAIDIRTRKPVLSTVTGGLSGPAIKPVALRMVYEVANAVDAPIIGMGGISCAEDAIEFMLAGADAVGIGTAIFADPMLPHAVISGIEAYLGESVFSSVSDMIGKMETP